MKMLNHARGLDKAHVFPARLGWSFIVTCWDNRWSSLEDQVTGWRPTRKWAARAAVRVHTRLEGVAAAYSQEPRENSPAMSDAFAILRGDFGKKELKQAQKKLQRTMAELS